MVKLLVIVMTTVWFPHARAQKVGETYIEVMKKYPTDRSLSKALVSDAVGVTKDGYKVVNIHEIKMENLLNSMRYQINA